MLEAFLAWWSEQLRALAPAWLVRAPDGRRAPDARVVVLHGPLDAIPPAVELIARRKGREMPLGRFVLDASGRAAARAVARPGGRSAAVELRLPPGLVLEREAVLPLAAERDTARVLRYEMDRLTPFAADELFWAWTVTGRDRANGRLHLRLLLAPKAPLTGLLEALADAGLTPGSLDASAPGGPPRQVALRPAAAGRWDRYGGAVAWSLCAALAAAAAAVPFARQWAEAAAAEERIAALRPQVEAAEALRRRITGAAAGTDAVAAQRARTGDAAAVLAALTETLPDDTHLTDFAMHGRIITFSGRSAAAARLIPALAAHPALRDPAFAAPVMRESGQGGRGGEGFTIRAEAAP